MKGNTWHAQKCLSEEFNKGGLWNDAGGFILFIYCFLGPHPWHMEVPRLGVESGL